MINQNIEYIKNYIEEKNLKGQVVIAIDGPCGGGKTSIAKKINEELSYNILHMDDLYLPFDKRDKNWTNIIAGHMDFDRLIQNVLIQRYFPEVICLLKPIKVVKLREVI